MLKKLQILFALLGAIGSFAFAAYLLHDIREGYYAAEAKARDVRRGYDELIARHDEEIADAKKALSEHQQTLANLKKKIAGKEEEEDTKTTKIRHLAEERGSAEADYKDEQKDFKNKRADREKELKGVTFNEDGSIKSVGGGFVKWACDKAAGVFGEEAVGEEASFCFRARKAERELKTMHSRYTQARDTYDKAKAAYTKAEHELNTIKADLKKLSTDKEAQDALVEQAEQSITALEKKKDEALAALNPDGVYPNGVANASARDLYGVVKWGDAALLTLLSLCLGALMSLRCAQFLGWTRFHLVDYKRAR